MSDNQIEGKNPVLEALRSGHAINKIFILNEETGRSTLEIIQLASQKGVPVSRVAAPVLNRMAATGKHQGVIAVAAEWKYAAVETITTNAAAKGEPPLILVLDGVEDPQNLGAIIRTAEAAGAHGIIIPERRAAGLSPAVGKASAGALEYLPVARVTNLSRTIVDLKKNGLWFTGADMEGTIEYSQADLRGPMGLVVGGEGRGLSRLVSEHCDQLIRLPMWGRVGSLNVSVATGILLYEIRRQRAQATHIN